MDAAQRKRVARTRRHRRIRKHLAGTPQRPRLVVYRSNARMYAQVVDDTVGRTLVAASTLDADLGAPSEGGKVAAARAVGGLLAERAKAAGIEQVIFDRGGNQYHGRVAALAEGAREGGLTL